MYIGRRRDELDELDDCSVGVLEMLVGNEHDIPCIYTPNLRSGITVFDYEKEYDGFKGSNKKACRKQRKAPTELKKILTKYLVLATYISSIRGPLYMLRTSQKR